MLFTGNQWNIPMDQLFLDIEIKLCNNWAIKHICWLVNTWGYTKLFMASGFKSEKQIMGIITNDINHYVSR